MALASLLVRAASVGVAVLVAQYAFAYVRSPLKGIPGPFLAKFTNIWRFWNHYTKTHIETQQVLHAKYGEAVRLGPNVVSLSDPRLVKTIYSTRGTFLKSEYYSVNDSMQDGHRIENIFGTRSNEIHSKQIRPVQKLYSFQSAYELEPLMNKTLDALCHQLEERFIDGANKGKTCDIADWISYFTWDFLGDMTLSKRFGFMEQGKDVDNTLATAEKVMRYFSVVGQIPALDNWLAKNNWSPIQFPNFNLVAGFCVQRFMERMQNYESLKEKVDFMNWFVQVKNDNPENVNDNMVIGYLIINILGGADTTSIVLKSIFYHILKTPAAHKKLVAELHASKLTFPQPYTVLENLPYLNACIKEGLRMHPVTGQILERIVPQSGLTLSNGTAIPPGTIVGINAWVVQYDESVYGEKPEEFRPERWLQGKGEDTAAYEARLKFMKDTDLSFGSGNRTCLGRPLATVELYKTTATLFAKYKIELEDPTAEWEVHKQWFVWPHKIRVKMSSH